MSDQQGPGCGVGFSFGILVIMALIGLLAVAGAAPSGSGNTTRTTTTEVHIFSDNVTQILSPQTTVNSNNAPTNVTGDRNNVTSSQGQALCWDAALNTTTSSACGVQP